MTADRENGPLFLLSREKRFCHFFPLKQAGKTVRRRNREAAESAERKAAQRFPNRAQSEKKKICKAQDVAHARRRITILSKMWYGAGRNEAAEHIPAVKNGVAFSAEISYTLTTKW